MSEHYSLLGVCCTALQSQPPFFRLHACLLFQVIATQSPSTALSAPHQLVFMPSLCLRESPVILTKRILSERRNTERGHVKSSPCPPSPPFLPPPPFPRWVREMYAFSIAAALVDMPLDLPRKPRAIMSQVG